MGSPAARQTCEPSPAPPAPPPAPQRPRHAAAGREGGGRGGGGGRRGLALGETRGPWGGVRPGERQAAGRCAPRLGVKRPCRCRRHAATPHLWQHRQQLLRTLGAAQVAKVREAGDDAARAGLRLPQRGQRHLLAAGSRQHRVLLQNVVVRHGAQAGAGAGGAAAALLLVLQGQAPTQGRAARGGRLGSGASRRYGGGRQGPPAAATCITGGGCAWRRAGCACCHDACPWRLAGTGMWLRETVGAGGKWGGRPSGRCGEGRTTQSQRSIRLIALHLFFVGCNLLAGCKRGLATCGVRFLSQLLDRLPVQSRRPTGTTLIKSGWSHAGSSPTGATAARSTRAVRSKFSPNGCSWTPP